MLKVIRSAALNQEGNITLFMPEIYPLAELI